jgi:hypothetical protein
VWHCYFEGTVVGSSGVGGLAGKTAYYSLTSNCYSKGFVSGAGSWTGGLVGWNDGTTAHSYSEADVDGGNMTGGLAGRNYDTITDCYSTGNVLGINYVGGLVGENTAASISNCYSTGTAAGTGSSVGGLAGYRHNATVLASFWDVNSSGLETSAGGTGLPTTEMQRQDNFIGAGWDFVGEMANGTEDAWTIHEGADYPKLVWDRLNFVGWDEVNTLDFAYLANRWMNQNCGTSEDCDGADVDFSGAVDWRDLKILCDHWLEGTIP